MQAAKYLLLVIDLLNDYFRQQAPLAARRDQLVASVNRLAAAFRFVPSTEIAKMLTPS
jgi:nicotinamidase-related amidase